MNIYYTAKDIEELVAKGIYQLELGPSTSLTDFARETAEQLDVKLIEFNDGSAPGPAPVPAAASPSVLAASQAYHKPRGCQVGGEVGRPSLTQASSRPEPGGNPANTPVNRLVDMMGKIIKRGV